MTSGTGYCFPLASWPADSNYIAYSIRGQTLASKISPTVSFTNAPSTAPYFSSFTVVANTTDANVAAVITASAGSACSAH